MPTNALSVHGPALSGNVGTSSTSLVGLGMAQADVDKAAAVYVTNHGTVPVYFTCGPDSSSGPFTKREVPGAGLITDYTPDTPVATDGAQHGISIPVGVTSIIAGRQAVRLLRMIATVACRVTVCVAANVEL